LTDRAAPRTEPFPQAAPPGWTWPTQERWRAYGLWSGWIAIAFFSVYPTLNWITSLRAQRWHLYVPAELSIPFVPEFICASIDVRAVPDPSVPAAGRGCRLGNSDRRHRSAGGICLPAGACPLELCDAGYAKIYAALFGLDRPYNLVPSLHVYFSAAIALACAAAARPLTRASLLVWLGVIVLSTLLTHQHHVVDIVAAFALLFIVRRRYEVTHA
jgi:hypothetical protein